MIRSTKNIFTVAALALLCVPALRCEDTQQQVLSKDTLKQSITQIPHIYNPEACITSFKTKYDRFMQGGMSAQEKAYARQELLTTAQEIKESLQQKINVLNNDNKIDKKQLAKGVGGMACGLIILAILNHNFNPFPYSTSAEIPLPEGMMIGGSLGVAIGLIWASAENCFYGFDPKYVPRNYFKNCSDVLDEIITHIQKESVSK